MINNTLIHIAYAEDHPVTRNGIIALLLPLGGIAVDFTADNGKELIDKLEQAETLPDICMLDIQMPVMDGFEAVTEIRKKWPYMKCLALSMYQNEPYVLRMIQCGANGYLPKRCQVEDIRDALFTIHKQGYYYSDIADSKLFHLARNNSLKLPVLTEMEAEVLKLSCSELTYGQIADRLDTTLYSIEGCRNRLFIKLHVNTRIGLALYAIEFGLVQLPLGPSAGIEIR